MSEYAQKECPFDRCACRYEECADGCVKLPDPLMAGDFTAEASHISEGLGWLGFWIGVGLIGAAIVSAI
jgi:hypothetical protein